MPVRPLPNWAMRRYAKLWRAFGTKEFLHDDALRVLREKDPRFLNVALSRMRKYGWLTLAFHPDDARKRVYTLKNPEDAVGGITDE